jgi:hypothetical protein
MSCGISQRSVLYTQVRIPLLTLKCPDIRPSFPNLVSLATVTASPQTHVHSFIRQRHSYSRLSISQTLFDDLLSEFQIFAQIKDFVLCFGLKASEDEVGSPRVRFRLIASDAERPPIVGYGKSGARTSW